MEIEDLMELMAEGKRDNARIRQLRQIISKYRETCSGKEELQSELKKKLGIDIIFFGRKDNPYGFHLVDHKTRTVIPGPRVMRMDAMFDFDTSEERFQRIESFIYSLFEQNPKITQQQIFDKLRRSRAYIKKGVIYSYDGESRDCRSS